MVENETELIKELNCDELCVISSKKEKNKAVMKKKQELVEDELYDKTCPPC
jgi:hypothetical protein